MKKIYAFCVLKDIIGRIHASGLNPVSVWHKRHGIRIGVIFHKVYYAFMSRFIVFKGVRVIQKLKSERLYKFSGVVHFSAVFLYFFGTVKKGVGNGMQTYVFKTE